MSAPHRLRVLAALRAAGGGGIRQSDFLDPVMDGGERITRLTSRVGELRDRGHVIATTKVGRETRYVLLRDGSLPTGHRRPAAPASQRAPGAVETRGPGIPRPAYTPPCHYAGHRTSDWRKTPAYPVMCGVCHPPVPGMAVERIGGRT